MHALLVHMPNMHQYIFDCSVKIPFPADSFSKYKTNEKSMHFNCNTSILKTVYFESILIHLQQCI